jgi:hypothetical protein
MVEFFTHLTWPGAFAVVGCAAALAYAIHSLFKYA